MGRSSLRHSREIQGVDSAGQTAAEFGEKYNNRTDAAGNPVGPGTGPTAVAFFGSIEDTTGNDSVYYSLSTGNNFSGSDTPLVFTVASGTLPTGTSLDADTGEISGTPSAVATYGGISITCTDASSDTATSNLFEIDILA